MAQETVAADSTIADVVGTLIKPTEYVRKVSECLWACQKERGSATVRIGTLGEGRAPNYLIEYALENSDRPKVYGAYYGLGHKQFENFDTNERIRLEPVADRNLVRENWSTRAMILKEVGELLLKLRKEGRR